MDIRIRRLTLDNFKSHRHLNLQFNGQDATLYGDNATGKTSVYDALTWLLFGKDSAGNGEKNIDIKPLDTTGAVRDHKAITSVEAELMVDGEVTIFKRTYQEVWTTRRGSSQAVYSGNTSEYFVDGVPCKLYAFEEKINEIVPEDVFRLLTSVGYFPAAMKWQERRATLFDMAGTMTDREIMTRDEMFIPLLEGMGKLSLDDYKKKLAAEKRGFSTTRDQTPARLDECRKAVQTLECIDFDAARKNLEVLEADHQKIIAQIAAVDNDTAAVMKQNELAEKRLELRELENKNTTFRAQQTVGEVNLEPLRRSLSDRSGELASLQAQIRSAENSLAGYESKVDEARNRWIEVNAEAFYGGSCPTCGQQLPADQLQDAMDRFERQKRDRLAEIQRTAEAHKAAKAQQEVNIQSMKDRLVALESDVLLLKDQIAAAEAARVIPKDMDGYTESRTVLEAAIRGVQEEISAIQGNFAQAEQALAIQKTAIENRMREQREIIAKEGLLSFNEERIEQINADAKTASEALEAIAFMQNLVDEFTRYKTKFVESNINSLFRIAKFRLFREQANGGIEDRCDVVYDGVPYSGLNSGMKINVGIDIINALSRHYGVTVPLFVDNAESVTRLEPCNAQVIRLVVSESDKELRVTYA